MTSTGASGSAIRPIAAIRATNAPAAGPANEAPAALAPANASSLPSTAIATARRRTAAHLAVRCVRIQPAALHVAARTAAASAAQAVAPVHTVLTSITAGPRRCLTERPLQISPLETSSTKTGTSPSRSPSRAGRCKRPSSRRERKCRACCRHDRQLRRTGPIRRRDKPVRTLLGAGGMCSRRNFSSRAIWPTPCMLATVPLCD